VVPVSMSIFILLFSCLERVSGEPVPLDEGFYLAAESNRASPDGGEGGGGVPFASYSGEKTPLRGVVISDSKLPIDIDIRTPDSNAPGGMARQGKVILEEPGEFEILVPIDIGTIELQAFQDLDSDGPNGDDPFGDLKIDVSSKENSPVELVLKVGGHQEHMEGTQEVVPHGTGSEEAPDPFFGFPGERILLSGVLACDQECELIDLDLFQPTDDTPGGRKMLGKIKVPPGDYEINVPINFGTLVLEAFVDFNNDGPGIGDLMGRYIDSPIQVLAQDISNVDIRLSPSESGKMPMGEAPPPPPLQKENPPKP